MPFFRLDTQAALAEDATKGSAPPVVSADLSYVLVGYALIVAGAAAGYGLFEARDPAAFVPVEGIGVFAPLYILAQVIERAIEPFVSHLAGAKAEGGGNTVRRADAVEGVYTAVRTGKADEAAAAQRLVDRIRRNTAVIAWAVASVLGMLACGFFGIFFLRLVGFAGVPEWVDLIISGLAVGSGTKPLHDLITNIQKAKEQKEDLPQRTGA